MRLEGKTAVITGSSRGIGAAIALGFAKEGCSNIVVNYHRSEEKALEVKKRIEGLGRRCLTIKADVSKREDVEGMFHNAISEFRQIDILVNNAGIIKRTPFLEIDDKEWKDILFVGKFSENIW